MGLPPVEIINDQSVHNNKPVAYILDDDRQVGQLVTRMLSSLGYVALPFADVAECLQSCKTAKGYAKPTLFVLDLSLGNSDAIEVVDQLRAIPYKGDLLLISGTDETTLVEVQRMAAAKGLATLLPLKKPFRLEALKDRLDAGPEETFMHVAPEVPKATANWAVSNGKLELRYQLKYDLKTSSACGADALFYTRHPFEGIAPLDDTMPPPNSPLYAPLARFAIRQVITDWEQQFSGLKTPIVISVRLPLAFVSTPGFVTLLRESVPVSKLFPGLIIETPDWKLFNDEAALRATSIQLGLYRVRLAVRDVGAAYTTIANSQKFPFGELRVRSSFVAGCWRDEEKRGICKNIIDVGHKIGSPVCAMGVSNREELQALVDMGCDRAVGNVFGQPQLVDVVGSSLSGPPTAPSATPKVNDDPFAWPEATAEV